MKAFVKLVSLSIIIYLNFSDALFSQPQEIKFDRISLEQGLSQISVYATLQDSRGFMWFGTENGFNRNE